MLSLVLCWSITLVSQAPAPVPAPADEAVPVGAPAAPLEAATFEAIFDEGRRLYDRFEFEKAAFRFRAASRLEGLDAVSAARAHMWLGLAEAQAGDETSARGSFMTAVRIDDTVTLPDDAPPPLRPLFSEARAAALAAPATGTPRSAPSASVPAATKGGIGLAPVVGASLGAAGLLLGATGGLVGLAAVSQADAAREERFQSDAEAAFTEAEGTAGVATVLVAAGVVALAAGTTVAIVGTLLDEPTEARERAP